MIGIACIAVVVIPVVVVAVLVGNVLLVADENKDLALGTPTM